MFTARSQANPEKRIEKKTLTSTVLFSGLDPIHRGVPARMVAGSSPHDERSMSIERLGPKTMAGRPPGTPDCFDSTFSYPNTVANFVGDRSVAASENGMLGLAPSRRAKWART